MFPSLIENASLSCPRWPGRIRFSGEVKGIRVEMEWGYSVPNKLLNVWPSKVTYSCTEELSTGHKPGHLVPACVGKRAGGLSDFLDVLRQLNEHWRPEGHSRELAGVRHEAKSQGTQASCQTSHSGASQ